MHISTVVLLVVTPSYLSIVGALPTSCKPEWKIDWYQEFPDFSNFQSFFYPGEILPGITVNDTIYFTGLLWNAPSWQEIMGRVCIQYGPLIYAQISEPQIRRECDLLVASLKEGKDSDIAEMCILLWNQIGVEDSANSLLIDYDECIYYSMQQDIPTFNGSMCDFDPFVTIFADDLLRKTSRVAFDVLEWLGPSPFSGDWYGGCSAIRLLLSNRIDQIAVDLETRLLRYLVADTLEYLKRIDICVSEDQAVMRVLRLLPITDDEYICDFLSGNPSQEEYLQNGEALVQTFLSVPVDEDLCTNVIAFVSEYDPYGANGYQLTGRDFTSLSNRRQFCREIASSFSGNTQTPMYSFPNSYDIENWYIFDEAGQILPGFSFFDAVNVIAEFLRSDSLLDGGVVLCNVFESFASQFQPSVKSICTALRDEDTETVERFCRILSLPIRYFHPSLRVPTALYAVVTGTDMIRKLFDLREITKDKVCQAQDDFFHSENNLQSLTRFALDVSLSELLPIADGICKDYDSVLDFIEKRTYYLDPTEFQQIVQQSRDIILAHLGYSDRETFCQSIAAGIDSSTGRARSSLTKDMEDRVLQFLTDPGRCRDSIESIQRLFQVSQSEFNGYFYQFTGYKSITSLCENLSVSFDPARCKASPVTYMPMFTGLFLALTALITCVMNML